MNIMDMMMVASLIVEWIWSLDYGSGMREKWRDDKEEGAREGSEWEIEKKEGQSNKKWNLCLQSVNSKVYM